MMDKKHNRMLGALSMSVPTVELIQTEFDNYAAGIRDASNVIKDDYQYRWKIVTEDGYPKENVTVLTVGLDETMACLNFYDGSGWCKTNGDPDESDIIKWAYIKLPDESRGQPLDAREKEAKITPREFLQNLLNQQDEIANAIKDAIESMGYDDEKSRTKIYDMHQDRKVTISFECPSCGNRETYKDTLDGNYCRKCGQKLKPIYEEENHTE